VGDGLLGQPFQAGAGRHGEALGDDGLGAGRAVELGGAGRGDERPGPGAHGDLQAQAVAAHHAARRMQDVGMADGGSFRIKRALDTERPLVAPLGQQRPAVPGREAQVQPALPAPVPPLDIRSDHRPTP